MQAFASRLSDQVIGDPADVALVALTEADLPAIERLLSEAEVAAWWRELDIEELRSFITTDEYVTPFRVIAGGETVGYAHVYHANRDAFWVAFGVPKETFGLDLSIGSAAARGRGIGRKAVRLLIERLLQWPEVVRVQIDPESTNVRAIRSYAAAGFVPRGKYPGYDGDEMLYMTVAR
jgi:lysine N-acyltransferase